MAPTAALTLSVTDSRLLASLARITRAHPHARKRLIGVDVNHGRELLLVLAQRTGGWVGWEATTLRSIADDLTFVALHERGLRVVNDVAISALVSQAFDQMVDERFVSDRFGRLGRYRGFRTALQDSILELRQSDVSAGELGEVARPDSPAANLVSVMRAYEALLAGQGLLDPADIFRLALEMFEREAPFVLDGITALIPTLSTRGVSGALVQRLMERGAALLDIDRSVRDTHISATPGYTTTLLHLQDDAFPRSVLGWSLVNRLPVANDRQFDAALVALDLFAAATPSEELREVCRRVIADGLRWDDVEIVATDPDTYGIALDAISQQLGFSITMLKGIPLIRTRLGRALERWFAWLGNGLPADVLRQALEAGEITVSGNANDAHAIARELRAHKVGWGRARYEALCVLLDAVPPLHMVPADDDVGATERALLRTAHLARRSALRALLTTILDITPPVPERGIADDVQTTTAELARRTLRYLTMVPTTGSAESQTLQRLMNRLRLLAELPDTETDFHSAMAELREGLSDLRAWPPTESQRKPFSADGGMVHLTDLVHAGATGRRRTFVVGLDADRAAGGARQDPLVPDALRRTVGRDRLPDVSDRRKRWAESLGVAIGSLRGRVTLSYSMRGTGDGRTASPSPLMLQAFRVQQGDASLTYENLRSTLLPPACAVPHVTAAGDASLLDVRDVWLHAIGATAVLCDATAAVRDAFPMLAAGLDAQHRAESASISASHGLVPDAGSALDPTHDPTTILSPSSLETLGKCPLQWFYRRGLGLTLPDDPEYDIEAWLDARERGSLLHAVFETFVQRNLANQSAILGATAEAEIRTLTDSIIADWRTRVPPPSESVFVTESLDLHRAARAFLQMERDALRGGDLATWKAIELGFGYDTPVSYRLSDGRTFALRGRADRIDALPDGTLRVVDYKTGKPDLYRPRAKVAPCNGGRLLQPALYASAISSAMGQPVSTFEYRFPTTRGRNAIVEYPIESLSAVRDVITALVEHVTLGRFVPTTDADDCRFCDYASICRVRIDGHEMTSPRAAWASEHAESLPEYVSMLRRRDAASEDNE